MIEGILGFEIFDFGIFWVGKFSQVFFWVASYYFKYGFFGVFITIWRLKNESEEWSSQWIFQALIFFRLLLSNCLNWKIHCDDHSSLSSTTAVQIWIHFIYFTSNLKIGASSHVSRLCSSANKFLWLRNSASWDFLGVKFWSRDMKGHPTTVSVKYLFREANIA